MSSTALSAASPADAKDEKGWLIRLSRIVLPAAIVAAGLAAYHALAVKPPQGAVELIRSQPRAIGPIRSDPRTATDAQLRVALARTLPPAGPPNTNKVLHALRAWGPEAVFADPRIPSGRQLHAFFLDDAEFRRQAGDHVPPLFTLAADGVNERSFEKGAEHLDTASHHINDVLATLIKAGTPLDQPLKMRNGETTLRFMVESAMRRAYVQQYENEWTMMVYARYVFPLKSWRNIYGQQVHADDLIGELLDRPLRHGACVGVHRLEALTLLLRADDEENRQGLSPQLRRRILDHLTDISRRLVAAQSAEGFWTRYWADGAGAHAYDAGSDYDRLLATGHHLEWLALAPEEVLPPRETIIRATQWTARVLAEIDQRTLDIKYGPISHAARALCLWRGMEPFEAWQMLHAPPATH